MTVSRADQAAAPQDAANAVATFAVAVSSDIDVMAALHDREPNAAVIAALQAAPIEEQLALVLGSEPALAALAALSLAVGTLADPADQACLDTLAADYADVYLRYSFRAAPEESVWMTEDGLQRQAPMFEVREIYRRHSLKVTDWAGRADDHLVVELRFLAHLLAKARTREDFAASAQFLDDHLLRWVKRFAVRLVQAGAPDFYAALGLLTASYLEELRDHLTELSGIERRPIETGKPRNAAVEAEAAVPYVPGAAPSW